MLNRRDFIGGAAIAGLTGCAPRARVSIAPPQLAPWDVPPKLMPVRAATDRIFRVTVCLRPFRAAGPRLDVERGRDKERMWLVRFYR
ncbi:MAG: twin-arginine translocation signal domain-containing protein, partial [Bryobacteraceae bacterium]